MTLEEMEAKLDAKDEQSAKLWESMARDAMIYSSPLFALKGAGPDESLEFAGSGTFVREGERYFILTARHVWQLKLKESDAVGVVLRVGESNRARRDFAVHDVGLATQGVISSSGGWR